MNVLFSIQYCDSMGQIEKIMDWKWMLFLEKLHSNKIKLDEDQSNFEFAERVWVAAC